MSKDKLWQVGPFVGRPDGADAEEIVLDVLVLVGAATRQEALVRALAHFVGILPADVSAKTTQIEEKAPRSGVIVFKRAAEVATRMDSSYAWAPYRGDA